MKKIFFCYLIISLFSVCFASDKDQIIKNFSKTNSLSFNFTQTINGKDESGKCIIMYPKKIYCKYDLRYNKVLVSNGTSLVIKSDKNKQYYRYALKSTPLNYLLDKDFILKLIKETKIKILDKKFFYFSINENNQFINIFFDINNFNLIGWQTEDIYQNLSVTRIYDLKKNIMVNEKKFILPKLN